MLVFGDFYMDCDNAQLYKDNNPLALTPKAFAVLVKLVESAGKLVSKETLLKEVWSGTVVTDAALTVCIREIRKSLGDKAQSPLYIATVHRRGFRFICPVETIAKNPATAEKTFHDSIIHIDRQQESEKLQNALTRARRGERQTVFVSGEAGLGKTRLVENFIEKNDTKSIRFTRGQCIEHDELAEPYLPWLDALTKLCREDNESLNTFKSFAPLWLLQMPSLLNDSEREQLERQLSGTKPERMMREMLEALQALSQENLLVIYLEDLHFSDAYSIQLLGGLVRRLASAKLMIIACFRPAELIVKNRALNILKNELEVRGLCTEIPLNAFTDEQVNHYILNRLPVNNFPDELARAIHIRTEGNPLFIMNVVEYLLKENWIENAHGEWTLGCDIETVKTCLPENLMQMLGYHIEQMDADIQALLEAAAVAGNAGVGSAQFLISEVAAALNKDPAWVEDQCEQLSRSQHFLHTTNEQTWPDRSLQICYAFTHGLYQKAFYNRLTKAKRAQLHQQIGHFLADSLSHYDAEISSKLAVHFEQGRDYARAAYYLQVSAETASMRGANREALNSLNRAIELARQLPDRSERDRVEMAIYITMGPILIAEKGNTDPAVEKIYLNAKALALKVGDTEQMFPIVFGLRSYNLLSGHLKKAHQLGENLLQIAKTLDDEDLLTEAHVALASTAFFLGQFQQSLQHTREGLNVYAPDKHAFHVKHYGLDPGVFCHCRAAQTLWSLGYPDQALDRVGQALAWAKKLEHRYTLAFAYNNHAWVNMFRREAAQTNRHAQKAIVIAKEHGFPFYKVWGQTMQSWALVCQGQYSQGIKLATSSLDESTTMAYAVRSYLLTILADIYLNADECDKGLQVLDEIPERTEHFLKAQRFHLRGNFLLMQACSKTDIDMEKFTQAQQWFIKALAFASNQQAKSFELRIGTSLARLMIQKGDNEKAVSILKPIIKWFSEGYQSADYRQAMALLEGDTNRNVIDLSAYRLNKKNTG